MLSNVIKHSGIYAKTCALRAGFLLYEDYQRLAECHDVVEFVKILGEKKSYKESAEEAAAYGVNRVSLERSLYRALHRDYTAIHSFMTNTGERNYLDVIFLRYEISLIKRALRRIFDQRDIQNVIPKTDKYLFRRMKLDVEKFGHCTDFGGFMEAISSTEFYDVLSKVNKETGTLFEYELQLDFYRYLKTHKYQNKYLSRADAASQQHINGSEVDLMNIIWIHRAKTYYDIDGERIFAFLMPLHYLLKTEDVKALVTCEDDSAFLDILKKTHYKDVFTLLVSNEMEKSYYIYMNTLHNMERGKRPFSIASVTWHLHYRALEIRNLTTLIECVRYKLPAKESLQKLNTGLYKVGDSVD